MFPIILFVGLKNDNCIRMNLKEVYLRKYLDILIESSPSQINATNVSTLRNDAIEASLLPSAKLLQKFYIPMDICDDEEGAEYMREFETKYGEEVIMEILEYLSDNEENRRRFGALVEFIGNDVWKLRGVEKEFRFMVETNEDKVEIYEVWSEDEADEWVEQNGEQGIGDHASIFELCTKEPDYRFDFTGNAQTRFCWWNSRLENIFPCDDSDDKVEEDWCNAHDGDEDFMLEFLQNRLENGTLDIFDFDFYDGFIVDDWLEKNGKDEDEISPDERRQIIENWYDEHKDDGEFILNWMQEHNELPDVGDIRLTDREYLEWREYYIDNYYSSYYNQEMDCDYLINELYTNGPFSDGEKNFTEFYTSYDCENNWVEYDGEKWNVLLMDIR